MRFYARFACGNPHFRTSQYKMSKRFLDECDYITRLQLMLQTHARQKTFHRTQIVLYYFTMWQSCLLVRNDISYWQLCNRIPYIFLALSNILWFQNIMTTTLTTYSAQCQYSTSIQRNSTVNVSRSESNKNMATRKRCLEFHTDAWRSKKKSANCKLRIDSS